MVDKVKDYKAAEFKVSDASTSRAPGDESAMALKESNSNLYCYDGFALHSMIQQHNKAMQEKSTDLCLQRELRCFRHLLITRLGEREKELPGPIVELNQGRLHMVKPEFLSFLWQLVENVVSKVDDT